MEGIIYGVDNGLHFRICAEGKFAIIQTCIMPYTKLELD